MTPHDSPGASEPPDDSEELPQDSGGSPDDANEVVDTTFDVLSDARRRHALYYLRERESTTLDELATVLAGWLNAREDGAGVATPHDRECIRIGLHHGHLPDLSAAGFVHYEPDSGEVALADLPEFTDVAIDRSLATDRAQAGERDRRGGRDASNRRNT